MRISFLVAAVCLAVRVCAIAEEQTFESVFSHLDGFRGLIDDGESLEESIIWLYENKVDRDLLRKAAWAIFDDSTRLVQDKNSDYTACYMGKTGQTIALDYLSLCADVSDQSRFKSLYTDITERDNVRIYAFFAHLFSVGADGVEQVIDCLSNHELFNNHIRRPFYQVICQVYQWSLPNKRKAIVDAFKMVVWYEGDDKWMFLTCDDILKFFLKDYVRSQFRYNLIDQFLSTPFSDLESKHLKKYFCQAIDECTNPKVEITPSRKNDYHHSPYISYEETILGGKGIPEIKRMAIENLLFRKGIEYDVPEPEKPQADLRWLRRVAAAVFVAVVVGVIVTVANQRRKK
ncbi:MAG: hypothetical protein IJU44_13125 [Kiritimatiellae bacterium]|nr:hypothetical protein [Kiritimatiellia bacterium]